MISHPKHAATPTHLPSPVARRLSVIVDDNPDPNALHPIRVELDLADGRSLTCDVSEVLGSPSRPLSADAARAKFAACGASAALWAVALGLENAADTADLARL